MNLSEIENRFKKYIEEKENSEESKLDKKTRNRLWLRIGSRAGRPVRSIPAWTMAAASVIFILFTAYAFDEIKKRDTALESLQSELTGFRESKNQQALHIADLKNQLAFEQNKPPKIDTVYKTRIVYREPEAIVENASGKTPETGIPAQKENQRMIKLDGQLPDLANMQDDVESFKIEYGEKTKDGVTPWIFTIKYH